jgi:DNA anti-recombination protein RmuC
LEVALGVTLLVAILLALTLLVLLLVIWRSVVLQRQLEKRVAASHSELVAALQKQLASLSDGMQSLVADTARVRDIYQLVSVMVEIKSDQEALTKQLAQVQQELAMYMRATSGQDQTSATITTLPMNAVSKGKYGEAAVEQQLRLLPPQWVEYQVPFSELRRVEFALKTPDHRIIPIDSKWAAMELLAKYEEAHDEQARQILVRQIQNSVLSQATEVAKYLHEQRTLGFCIAVVPDPVFEMCHKIQGDLALRKIVLVSHSLLVPYLLLVIDFLQTNKEASRVLQTAHLLSQSLTYIERVQQVVDRKISQAFDVVKMQQVQHLGYNAQLQAITGRLQEVQASINDIHDNLPGSVNTLNVRELAAIPKELQVYLDNIRRQVLGLHNTTTVLGAENSTPDV